MTVTAQSFLVDFPEFTTAPAAKVSFWLTVAQSLVGWPTLADQGVELLTAHYVSLDEKATQEAAAGAAPGSGVGVTSSKGAGGLSISYDNSSSAEPSAGQLNLTTYGKRYAELRRMFGTGGLQLGVGWPFSLGPGDVGQF